MALAAVVRKVDIALSVAVAAPAPEILTVQMGDRHLDPLMPHVVMRPVVGDQIARQRVDGVEKRLGRLRLRHIRLVDVAEKRHCLPLQFQRGEAGRAVTVRRGLLVTGMGKSKSHGIPFLRLGLVAADFISSGQTKNGSMQCIRFRGRCPVTNHRPLATGVTRPTSPAAADAPPADPPCPWSPASSGP